MKNLQETVVAAKFHPGRIVVTKGAIAAFTAANETGVAYLVRHLSGDWGELDSHDREVNKQALQRGQRLLSHYKLKNGTRIWIVTEANRLMTTILLPEEY